MLSNSAFAFNENQALELTTTALISKELSCQQAVSESEKKYAWKTSYFQSRNDYQGNPYNVRFTQFGCLKGIKGSAVVSPGRTETSLKYLETAYDLIDQGYSPVFAIDHRGQGLSPRFLENSFKGHVEDFTNYVDDFEDFVNQIVLPKVSENLYFLSNSMGGAIGVRYFERVKEKSPFKKAVLFGPMLKIKLDDANANDQRSESSVRLQASLLCLSGLTFGGLTCNGYANPKWTDYNPSARHLDPTNPNPANLTHSLARFKARDFLWNEFRASRDEGSYQNFEHWESAALGGPTVRWTWQATKYNQIMRKISNLKKIQTPIVIVTGDKDIRADLEGHQDFYNRMIRAKRDCKIHFLKDAYHELMVESDFYRNQALNIMFEEFKN